MNIMTEKTKGPRLPSAADDLDAMVIVELKLPRWMRAKLNVRALEAGYDVGHRNDYVRQLLLAAWEKEDE